MKFSKAEISLPPIYWPAGILLSLSLTAPLILHGLLASYYRYEADDYCSAVIARSHGIFGGMVYVYQTWTGRFAANFLDGWVMTSSLRAASLVPAVALGLLVLVLCFTLAQIPLYETRTKNLFWSITISSLIILVTISGLPYVNESLYWGQGMRALIPPLILGTVFIGLTLYQARKRFELQHEWLWLIIGGCLTFLAGGFHESYLALQTTALIFCLLLGWQIQNQKLQRRWVRWISASLVGSLIAMYVVVSAPGNQFRQANFPPPPGMIDIALISLVSLVKTLGRILLTFQGSAGVIFCLFFPIVMGSGEIMGALARLPSEKATRRLIVMLPFIIFIILLAFYVPSAYGMSSRPPARSRVIPIYVFIAGLIAWGILLGSLMSRSTRFISFFEKQRGWLGRVFWSLTIAFAILVSLGTTLQLIRELPAYQEYAVTWEARGQFIRQAKYNGEEMVDIPFIANPEGVDQISTQASNWVNQCMQDYYRIIIVSSDSPNSDP